ncbi:MAG: histidinol-phosphatase [Erysipelotrichaceae bacterium]|nr:histidinol-phosphatase [Erysipelotrichaceae bacterium]MCI9524049.1 histidinol-phosphatase [Erysipelotrichaceae bacterium]
MKANYHTHTKRCHHAIGNDEDYVLAAIAGGFDEIGFSDHTPWKYDSDFVAHMRMKLSAFHEYKQSVLALKEKYKDQISILLGLEAEYYPRYMDWLKQFVHDEHMDYIIFGNHYYRTDEDGIYFGTACSNEAYLDIYAKECIKGMESGLYSYLCHPELFMRAYPRFDRHCERITKEICMCAKHWNIPLEYNLAGLQYNVINGIEEYPHHRFWEIAKDCGCSAIIGVDAHHYEALSDIRYWNQAVSYLDEELHIKRIERLEHFGF